MWAHVRQQRDVRTRRHGAAHLSAGQAVHAAAGGLQRGAAGEGDRAVRRQVQVRHPRHRLVQPVTQDLLLRAAAAAPGANVSPH